MKRSAPLKRSGFRQRVEGPTAPRERKPMARQSLTSPEPNEPKEGKCSHCGEPFLKLRPMQSVCGPLCASRKVKADRKAEGQKTKARKAALKTIPELIKEAQREFNAFIRERDRGRPCICCGEPLFSSDGGTGGEFDCGHYRSVGSASHLRFDERNAHGQRKRCNRYGAGRAVDYRAGLIARLGLGVVEELEADNRIHKWTREELIAIKDKYRQKLKELKKERA